MCISLSSTSSLLSSLTCFFSALQKVWICRWKDWPPTPSFSTFFTDVLSLSDEEKITGPFFFCVLNLCYIYFLLFVYDGCKCERFCWQSRFLIPHSHGDSDLSFPPLCIYTLSIFSATLTLFLIFLSLFPFLWISFIQNHVSSFYLLISKHIQQYYWRLRVSVHSPILITYQISISKIYLIIF